MWIAKVVFVGSLAVLVMTAPTLAKDTQSRKTDEKSTSSSCHAYQQAADGSWTELPCQEPGNGSTQHKPVAKGGEDEPR